MQVLKVFNLPNLQIFWESVINPVSFKLIVKLKILYTKLFVKFVGRKDVVIMLMPITYMSKTTQPLHCRMNGHASRLLCTG